MEKLIKKFLKHIHKEFKNLRIVNDECWIYFTNGDKMLDKEFKKNSDTRYLMELYKKIKNYGK
jgi:hypothetical protein